MDQVTASNVLSIWSGLTSFAPLVGAYLSDTYLGRFKTIAYAQFGSLLVRLTRFKTLYKRIDALDFAYLFKDHGT